MEEEKKKACGCRWKTCRRHGNCEECIQHHRNQKTHPLPWCMRKKSKKAAPPDQA